ncbi:hypothetical protein U0035_10195 [Niabella yanshanensis]|uniref:Uncharacterized protein n=1 Tax=Niabella yanshanensis TaxID=577386 RepID=A0ABZ0WB32_9BACT|nr:hypothetical protein [Niabella yanshanensis]WQD40518.1 hypothetical protein U0035_10195 [Niabella yanshanensis]
MNFDNLRSEWDAEKADDVQIPDAIEKLQRAKHPLVQLKATMKKELQMQVISLALFIFFPFILQMGPSLYLIYYLGFMVITIVSAYYLLAFSRFYKGVDAFDLASKDQLLKIYFDLQLNMERYRSWAFLLIPFLMFTIGLFSYSHLQRAGKWETLTGLPVILLFIIGFASMVFMIAATNWWLKYYYGKYVNQLKEVIDSLKEDN